MIHRKYILIFIVLNCFLISLANAQHTEIYGKVAGVNGDKIVGATITVFDSKDPLISTTGTSDTLGNFRIQFPHNTKVLYLTVSHIGYVSFRSRTYQATTATIDGGTQILAPLINQLQGVTIKGKKNIPVFERSAEKLIVNVEGSNLGGTSLDIINTIPGVIYQNGGSISINGRSGTRIMIDGKFLNLHGSSAENYLKSLDYSLISKIEVLSNPSARYDAEGSGGIINIILKAVKNDGISGTLGSNYTQGKYAKFSESLSLMMKKNRFSSSLTFNNSTSTNFERSDFTRQIGDADQTTFLQNIYSKIKGSGNFLNSYSEYQLDRSNSVGFLVRTNIYDEQIPQSNSNNIYSKNAYDSTLLGSNETLNRLRNTSLNLSYLHRLDTSGKLFTINFDRTFYRNNSTYNYNINYYRDISALPYNSLLFNSFIPNKINLYSAKTDFSLPFSKTSSIETGFKYSQTQASNEIMYNDLNSKLFIPGVVSNSNFTFKEYIVAGYFSYKSQLSKRLNFTSGLRIEHTKNSGSSNSAEIQRNSYLNLFPTVFTDYKITKENTVSLSVGRRIQRPNYRDLNPFVYLIDPYYYLQGNSGLKPQYSSYAELTYGLKSKYYLTVYYNKTSAIITQVPRISAQLGTTVTEKVNLGDYYNTGLVMTIPVKVSSNWTQNFTTQLFFRKYGSDLNENLSNNQALSYRLNLNGSVKLPRSFSIDYNGYYQSKIVQGLYQINKVYTVNVNFQKSFDHIDVRLLFADLFNSNKTRTTYAENGQSLYLKQRFDYHTISISFLYKFKLGNKISVRNKKEGNADEILRL